MKRSFLKIVLSFVALSLVASAGAQDSKWALGVHVGSGFSSARGNKYADENLKPSIGFLGGASVQYNFTSHLSLRTEVLYERKVQKSEVELTDINGVTIGTIDVFSKFDGITVPLLVRYSIGEKSLRFFANAGPQLFILQKHQNSSKDSDLADFNDTDTKNFKSTDYGLAFGAGATYAFSDHLILSAELRDHLGVTNISKLELVYGGTMKLNAASLLLGAAYSF